jgi:hypothetical protein
VNFREGAAVKIKLFGRRRRPGQVLPGLLDNYRARAEAIADAGGGNLWVIEPGLAPDLLPDIADAIARHLAEQGVRIDGISVLAGTTSARIVVLAASHTAQAPSEAAPAPSEAAPAPSEAAPAPSEVVLPDADAAPRARSSRD